MSNKTVGERRLDAFFYVKAPIIAVIMIGLGVFMISLRELFGTIWYGVLAIAGGLVVLALVVRAYLRARTGSGEKTE